MAIKINKGGDLGKYFYLIDDVTYGPIKLDELLQRVDENTLVFYEGIDWTRASEIPELKKFVHTPPAQTESPENPNHELKSSNKSAIIGLLAIIIILSLFYFYNKNKTNSTSASLTDTAVSTIDSTIIEPQIQEPVDAYSSILSVKQIDNGQLQNLLLSDLITYQNDILARHGYIFESQGEVDHYKSFPWYNPVNNYLAATSELSEIEKYNFNAIQERINLFSTDIRNIIIGYYESISDKSFDATNFFSEKVEYFISKKNTTPWEINDEMQKHYEEFLDSKFTFAQDFDITYHESVGGVNYISFKGFFEAFRVSKNKKQECILTIKLGLNRNNKIVYYKEEKIENLKFLDINQ